MATFQKADGQNYAPEGQFNPVCKKGEFKFAAVGLEHGHIYGICNGVTEVGAQLVYVYDSDAKRVAEFIARYPDVKAAASYEEILRDPEIELIVCASIPKDRAAVGIAAMEHDKDFFADKPSVVTLAQLNEVKRVSARSGKKYMTYYSERFHTECTYKARELVKDGAIGKVVNVIVSAPHRINRPSRPAWFFNKDYYGGILCDLGCHMLEQFIDYADTEEVTIISSRVANFANKDYPKFDDFGDMVVQSANGVTGYGRLDWFTPEKLPVWGDGRMIITGTKGYIELRKYIDIGHSDDGDHLYLVSDSRSEHLELAGKVGYPFFGKLLLDCIHRTENALSQSRAFRAMELSLIAQNMAIKIE